MGFNILVVDDSAVMRSVIIKTLRISGMPLGEIYQAGNGAEALQVLEDNWVDVALVDINMPVMDGEEMIRRVRDNPDTEDLEMVVVSTESSDTRIESLRRKNVEFVHKPFTPEKLRETIFKLTGVSDVHTTGTGAPTGGDFDF